MLTVVCFLWSDPSYRFAGRYTAHHVNVLHAMLRRHLHEEHELVCVTDMPDGIDEDVRIVPLWDDMGLGNNWRRVKMFAPEMRDELGEYLVMMDLDVVITGDITPLFQDVAEFKTTKCNHEHTHYNTGFFYLKAGSRSRVWETFDPETSPGICDDAKMIGWEQAWVSYVLGAGERKWRAKDGVLNYRFDVVERGMDPEYARIVFFPGDYDPSLMEDAWIKRHWRL